MKVKKIQLIIFVLILSSLFISDFPGNQMNVKAVGYVATLENLNITSVYEIENQSSSSTAVFIESFYDMNGIVVATSGNTIDIDPGEKITRSVEDFDNIPNDCVGYVVITSDQPIDAKKKPHVFHDGFYRGLEDTLWDFSTNGNGSYFADNTNNTNPFLDLNSGTVIGKTAIASLDSFSIDDKLLRFETRVKTSGTSDYQWALQGTNGDGYAGFQRSSAGNLQAVLRKNDQSSEETCEISSIDTTSWHFYRVDLTSFYARFYIDGDLKCDLSEDNVPLMKALFIFFENSFEDTEKSLSIDFAEISTHTDIYSISGKITDGDGLPVKDMVIRLLPDDITTNSDPNGDYQFDSLAPGNYVIDSTDTIYNWKPISHSLTITNQNATNIDFVLTEDKYLYLPLVIR